MKCIRRIFILVVLFLALMISVPVSGAGADVKITVTFVAGGVAGGVYFLFYLSTGNAPNWQYDLTNTTALFNHNHDGWKVGYPRLMFVESSRSTYTPYMEIIKIQF